MKRMATKFSGCLHINTKTLVRKKVVLCLECGRMMTNRPIIDPPLPPPSPRHNPEDNPER